MVLPFLAALAPFAPLIGVGVSAIGSLLAPKPQPTVVRNEIDLIKLRDQAEEAGFNPLTIIRNGGLAGYGVNMMPAGPDYRLSNAFQMLGTGIANWSYDPTAVRRAELEIKIAEAQLEQFARDGAPANQSVGGVPTAVSAPEVAYQVAGRTIYKSPTNTDVGDMTQRSGEPMDWLAFPFVTWGDWSYTFEKEQEKFMKENPRGSDVYLPWFMKAQ